MNKYADDSVFILSGAKLTEVPSIPLGKLAIDLRKNQIKQIAFHPENSIEYIDLSDNLIKDATPLNDLKKADVIDCSYNLIEKIPVLRLSAISELYFIANDIVKIENINFGSLVKLDLAGNNIQKIENIEACKLEELFLASNKIEKIENISHLSHLRVLDLQYNAITEVDCSVLPRSLEILMLQGNALLNKIKNLDGLKHLKTVNLKGTPMEEFHPGDGIETW